MEAPCQKPLHVDNSGMSVLTSQSIIRGLSKMSICMCACVCVCVCASTSMYIYIYIDRYIYIYIHAHKQEHSLQFGGRG